MILSDQVPRAPTCTDIPIYRINMIAKIFWLNQIQVVWSNLDCFIDRLPASTNRGAAGHTDSTAAAACSSGARWNPGIWWFLRIFAPLLIEWRGNWQFKEGQSEPWNGSTQPPLKPNDPRWGPWQVRHKRHQFDGWFWLVGQPDELHPETAWAYAYHCFNAEETSSYSHTSHIVSTKVVGNTGEIIGQCCWFARADSYLPQICDMNLSQWISPPIGLHDFAPQTTRHFRLQRQQNIAPLQRWGHTLLHWNSFTLKHSSDVNVSMCRTSTDSSESRLWSSGGIHFVEVQCQNNQYTMLNHVLIHLERFHYIAAAEKRKGLATCSDTLTTAGSHQSYSKSVDPTQSRSKLAFCQTWLLTLSSANICIPLSCISRVGNRFARQKHLFLQFQFTSSRATTEAVRQHAGNRLRDLFWASNRLLVSAGVMVFAC